MILIMLSWLLQGNTFLRSTLSMFDLGVEHIRLEKTKTNNLMAEFDSFRGIISWTSTSEPLEATLVVEM